MTCSIEELEVAYKKFKSNKYFDKYSAITRKQVVEFESSWDFEEKLNNLITNLNGDKRAWIKYSNELINKTYIYTFPKTLKKEIKKGQEGGDDIISNIDLKPTKMKFDIEHTQSMINIPIELHIVSLLWIERIGKDMDKLFYEGSHGNRLIKNKENNEEIKKQTWSPYLFKPYYNEYESWRDKGLSVAEGLYDEQKDSLIIMMDIERFYYSVNFTAEIFESFIAKKNKDKVNRRINELVFDIVKAYSKLYSEVQGVIGNVNNILPIGFLPSAILANWYLDYFDKRVLDKLNPSYYGRYVDDIIIVEKVDKKSKLYEIMQREGSTKHDIIRHLFVEGKEGLLVEKGIENKSGVVNYQLPGADYEVSSRFEKGSGDDSNNIRNTDYKSEYYINLNNELYDSELGALKIHAEKLNVMYLRAEGTKTLLDKFRDEIKKNSSEFRLLPNGENLF